MNLQSLDELLAKFNGGQLRGAPRKLAQKLKINEATVSRWRTESKPPAPEIRAAVAKELGVSVDELMAAIEHSKMESWVVRDEPVALRTETGYRFIDVPHLGTVSASRFNFSFDLPPETFTALAVKGKAGDRYAVLRISGDCMAPKIEDGDEVLIRQTSHVEDGTIAVVCFDGECTLKRVFRKTDGVQLKADNPKYPAKVYPTNKIEVRAEVVKILKDPGRKP